MLYDGRSTSTCKNPVVLSSIVYRCAGMSEITMESSSAIAAQGRGKSEDATAAGLDVCRVGLVLTLCREVIFFE